MHIPQFLQSIRDVLWSILKSSFSIGFLSSLFAGAIFALLAFKFRTYIKRIFQPPALLHVRAPLMLASAPLFVSRTLSIWEERGLNVDLDFRYAGAGALNDLHDNRCDFAVASDVALASYVNDDAKVNYSVRVMPFVRIEDHLKFVVRENSAIKRTSDLGAGKKIGYLPDSVHNDFIKKSSITLAGLVPMQNVMDCYHSLIKNPPTVDACVLWEPHYRSFKDKYDMHLIDDEIDYTWFLCLIAKDEFLKAHGRIARGMLGAMRAVTRRCDKDQNAVIEACLAYLHAEFTGVGKKELEELLIMDKHHFGVDRNVPHYRKKLATLKPSYAFGAGRLWDPRSLWPDLRP